MAALLKHEGSLHGLGYADRLSRAELERVFARGWRIEALREARFLLRPGSLPDGVPSVLSTLRRERDAGLAGPTRNG